MWQAIQTASEPKIGYYLQITWCNVVVSFVLARQTTSVELYIDRVWIEFSGHPTRSTILDDDEFDAAADLRLT